MVHLDCLSFVFIQRKTDAVNRFQKPYFKLIKDGFHTNREGVCVLIGCVTAGVCEET